MTPTSTPTPYTSGIVSNRSRRLRMIAAVVLAMIVAMAIYGMVVLMPGVNRAATEAVRAGKIASQRPTAAVGSGATTAVLHVSGKQARILKVQVYFTYGYWIVWTVLVLSLLLIVWLDLREVSRSYLNQRLKLWESAANATVQRSGQAGDPADGGAASNGPSSGLSEPPGP